MNKSFCLNSVYLYGYNATSTVATFKAFNHIMQYLYHYLYVPIIYRRGSPKNDETLLANVAHGQVEIYEYNTPALL